MPASPQAGECEPRNFTSQRQRQAWLIAWEHILAPPYLQMPGGSFTQFPCSSDSHAQGYLSSPYLPTYYELAQRHPEIPRLTEKQQEAIQWYNALAWSDKLRLDMILQPGDIQLLSNHTQLHTRSAFVDFPVRTCFVCLPPVIWA